MTHSTFLKKVKFCIQYHNNMPAEKITLEHAKQDKLFYFVATVIAYRETDGRCLILKRSDKEVAHPGKFSVPGGKLEWKDLDVTKPTRFNGDVLDFEKKIEDLLAREVREEAGIEIERDLKYIGNIAYVRPDGIPSILLQFAAKYKSGEVVLEQGSFSDYAWVNVLEAKNYSCVMGIPEDVATTIKSYQI